MTRILAIDPGCTDSGYVVIDADTCQPIDIGKLANDEMRQWIIAAGRMRMVDGAVIEMVASYGMAVGAEVFETCVWIGRFTERLLGGEIPHGLIKRQPVKLHHCHSSKAKDANVTRALVDRFAPGQPNHGKGTKAEPGWFHGFRADIWAAYALAVYAADTMAQVEA